ncbi:MAG: cytochrome P450 [Chloroflexi bacterium]|nr:cytochrome P450 [Chloroflexota bacterium]
MEEIPRPPAKPVVGNLFDVDRGAPVAALNALARDYGPIFRLTILNREAVFVSGFALADELCDPQRFDKKVGAGLTQVRAFAGDGLFTAYTEEPNWRKAHAILLPAFSQQAMRDYFLMMVDIAQQLVKKWQRLNPDDDIQVTPDMTRLTLDTIGLCGFGYRFNSFYRQAPHPFVEAMTRCLSESMQRANRLPVQDKISVRERRQFDADVEYMDEMVDTLIKERRAQPKGENGKIDLLARMLTGVDKETNEGLDDVNIRYQIITFLIAGHETTSGLLSFALYLLMHHPDVLAKAYAEVDQVLGTDTTVMPTYQQMHQLRYITQVLKEALRLHPPAPAFTLQPHADAEVIGGKYRITRPEGASILVGSLHRDPSVWGDDAQAFNPDHFSEENERGLPPNAFKPFGNGQRACIGRQFAMLEAALVLGMILQRFELVDYNNYELKIHETLTEKPEGFTMKVHPRRTGQAAR